jgi:hypothetical protein
MSEMDDLGREFDQVLRVALTGAAQAAELTARRRAQQERAAAAATREEALRLQQQLAAERQAARAVYLAPGQATWWENATAQDVATAWQTAAAWAGQDPQAAAAQQAIAETVRRRWGLDVDQLAGSSVPAARQPGRTQDAIEAVDDRAAVRAQAAEALAAAEAARTEAGALRDDAEGLDDGPGDQGEGVLLKEAAEQEEPTAREQGLGEQLADRSLSDREYARARPEEMASAPETAREARLDAAQSFPVPARTAVRRGRGRTRARVVRAASSSRTPDVDRGR